MSKSDFKKMVKLINKGRLEPTIKIIKDVEMITAFGRKGSSRKHDVYNLKKPIELEKYNELLRGKK